MTPPPPTAESKVTLREITKDTVISICGLSVKNSQKQFVAPNSYSISQAYFSKQAWFRAIYADEAAVGFIMLDEDPNKPEYYLWRYMIDAKYQKMGFGRTALLLVIEYVKTRPNAKELSTSIVEAEGSPLGFYESLGFKLTGHYEDGEAVMKLVL